MRQRGEIRAALLRTIILGLDTYGHHAVGAFLVGIPAAALGAFSHFALGAPAVLTAGAVALVGSAAQVAAASRRLSPGQHLTASTARSRRQGR